MTDNKNDNYGLDSLDEEENSALKVIQNDQSETLLETLGDKDPSKYDLPHGIARRWIATRHGTHLSDETVPSYLSHTRIFLEFLRISGTNLLDAEFDDLLTFIEYRIILGSSKSTVRKAVTIARNLYRYIQLRTDENAVIKPNMFREINLKDANYQGGYERGALTTDEVKIFLDSFDHERNRLMAYVGIVTGARNSDIRTLKCSDVDYSELEIRIRDPKHGRPYEVPITPEFGMELERWKELGGRDSYNTADESEYMFPSRCGEHLKYNGSLNSIFTQTAERAGIQEVAATRVMTDSSDLSYREEQNLYAVTTHTLRHTYITLLKKAGAPPEARRSMANHKDIKTTKGYEHLDENWKDLIRSLLGSDFFPNL
jgi:integrase/recombinase XerD